MTFIYECDLYSLEIYRICKYELPTSKLSKVNRQTQADTTEIIIPRRFAGGHLSLLLYGGLCIVSVWY